MEFHWWYIPCFILGMIYALNPARLQRIQDQRDERRALKERTRAEEQALLKEFGLHGYRKHVFCVLTAILIIFGLHRK